MRSRFVVIAGLLSLLLSAVLAIRVLAIDKPGVLLILLPAVVGAGLALWRSDNREVVGLACGLTLVTALLSLIGGIGLLYVPTIALFIGGLVGAAADTSRPPT
jgi:hypothetical protein